MNIKTDFIIFAKVVLSSVLFIGCTSSAVPEPKSSEKTQSSSPGEAEIVETALPLLSKKLEEKSSQIRERIPPETIQIFVDGVKEVQSSGIVESALNVGDKAADGELTDVNDKSIKLSDLWTKGPVVLMWYRGGWCPYCNVQLRVMQEALPAIEAAGGNLVAIAPEKSDHSLSTKEKNQLEFLVLSDVGNKVARAYGLVFKLPEKVSPIYKKMIDLSKYNGDDSDELPLAATYVIDTTGVIRYAYLDANYTKRAEPSAIVDALKSL